MSWVVEESENTSAVNVNGDTIKCTQAGYYGSPINVVYKDPADKNGQYFWQIQFQELDSQSSGSVSVGLTTDQGFRAGWGLRAMKYLGNLSDGSALLVQAFGDQIKNNDKVGLLLQLTDAELKVYIFHNDRPLGLAFHVQSPYPKPLYPGKFLSCLIVKFYLYFLVVSFNSNGKAKISRSQQIPTSLNRTSLQFTGVEGAWKITNYSQHPECVGVEFEIKKENQNNYRLHTHVVNGLNCTLTYNPSNNHWTPSHVLSTMMMGPPAAMAKENVISTLISGIQRLDAQGDQQLVLQTNNGEQVRLQRFEVPGPQPVTQNIFS
jgi:hypothetical protein